MSSECVRAFQHASALSPAPAGLFQGEEAHCITASYFLLGVSLHITLSLWLREECAD